MSASPCQTCTEEEGGQTGLLANKGGAPLTPHAQDHCRRETHAARGRGGSAGATRRTRGRPNKRVAFTK